LLHLVGDLFELYDDARLANLKSTSHLWCSYGECI